MNHDELCYWSATATAAAIARQEVSPVDVVDAILGQIERLNPVLNAYCTVTAEQARQEARAAEQKVVRGEPLGLLHGVPVSVKDTLWTAGVRTTMGSAIYVAAGLERLHLSVQPHRKSCHHAAVRLDGRGLAGGAAIGWTSARGCFRAACRRRLRSLDAVG
jgi:hypothetical protein